MTRPGRLCELRQGGRPPGGPLRIILGILVVLSLNVFTAPAIAMTAGTRLRVTLPYSGGIRPTVIGAFIGVRSDTLLLGLDPESIETRAIAINDIAMLEESRGPRGNSLKAGVVGTLLGALIGGTLGAVAVGSSLGRFPVFTTDCGAGDCRGCDRLRRPRCNHWGGSRHRPRHPNEVRTLSKCAREFARPCCRSDGSR